MANSVKIYPALTAAQGTFAFPFSYLNANDIKAFVDGILVFENNASTNTAVSGTTYTVAFQSAGATTLTFSPDVAVGREVRIQRNTDLTSKAVDFTDGAVLTEVSLDSAVDQVFFAAQEAIDKSNESITEAADGKWDAQSKVIKNLADPVNNTDAVNKQFITTNLPNINTVAGIQSDVTTVAGKATEIDIIVNKFDGSTTATSGTNKNLTQVDVVADNIGSVNTVATNITEVVAVANDLNETVSEIETAALDLQATSSKIDTVATNIATVNTVGTDIANINTVAGDITNVNQLAGALSLQTTFVVTVAGGVFVIDGTNNPTLTLDRGATYVFDVSDSTVAGHPLAFKDGSGNSYTTGVTTSGTAGSANATVTIVVAANAPSSLRYYCTVHGNGMGNTISVVNNNLTTVASNITNVNNVGGSITNVNAVATDIAGTNTIGTVATNIANVNNVGNDITNVNNVANNATNINAVANNATNINAVNSNATNINAVAADATDIGTVATNINNVNSVGTNITSVNTVATNIANVNSFADTYYVSATEPSPTTIGDLWFDTTNNIMMVKAASGFVNAGSSVNGTSNRVTYTATAGQQNFNATYDAGFVDVYLNGVKLIAGTDFTASNGSSISLATGAAANDTVDIVGYGTFELSTTELNDLVGVSVPSPSNGNVLKYNGTNWIAASADVVDDTSPQLGADLDGNTFSIDLTSATDSMGVPVGTTAQQPAATAGHIRYDSDKGVLTYADGNVWKKVSAEIPSLNSISGNIYAGATTTLTLSGDKFLSTNLVVNFLQTADNINQNVTVTPTSNTSASVAVPAAVYNNVTAGNSVQIQVTNSDSGISGTLSKTALSLPTGGTVTTVGGFRVHQINSTGNFVIPTGVSLTADYVIVAGGGGGGGWGGGGGAGGVIEVTSQAMTAGTFQATIGGGGNGGTSAYTSGGAGNPSSFNGTTAIAGGYGGHHNGNAGGNGGSGGGGGMGVPSGGAGGSGTAGQGNNGGIGGGQDSNGNWLRGGGGGGKAAAGINGGSGSTAGNGGSGADYSTNYGNIGHGGYLGGGGAGHVDARGGLSRAIGGQGGGGDGGSYHDTNGSLQLNGGDGLANTGGGGGGGYGSGNMDTGVGGSGTVLIRYQLS